MASEPEIRPQASDPAGGLPHSGEQKPKPFADVFERLVSEVRRLLAEPTLRVRMVVDGAGFDDAPDLLTETGVYHRPLYRGSDRHLVSAGPHLVDLYRDPLPSAVPQPASDDDADLSDEALAAEADRAARTMKEALDAGDETGGGLLSVDPSMEGAIDHGADADQRKEARHRFDRIVAALGPTPFMVLWVGGPGLSDAIVFKHLRTLNKVLIPKPKDEDGEDAPFSDYTPRIGEDAVSTSEPVDPGGYEAVLFRHADGNGLAQVLPALTPGNLSRLFGPADILLYASPDYPGPSGQRLTRASRAGDGPTAPPGMMRLSQSEIERIEFRRLERIKRRVGERLEPVLYRELGAEEARRALSNQSVARSIDEGYALGFRSERSLYQWSLLQTSSAGELGKDPRIGQYLRSERTGLSADERLDAVFKRLAHLKAAHGGASA